MLDLPEVRICHQGKNEEFVERIKKGRAEGRAERDGLLNVIQELKKQFDEFKKIKR